MDGDAARRLFAEKHGSPVWFLLNFSLWYRRYICETEHESVVAVN